MAIGREVGEPLMVGRRSHHSRNPKNVVVNVNKNTEIFMAFGIPPLMEVEKSSKYLGFVAFILLPAC